MGILADIFVSSLEDGLKYESIQRSGLPAGRFERAEFKGLTTLEFGTLWALIEGEEFDLDKHALEPLSPGSSSWLYRFPQPFVLKLSALTPAAMKKATAEWSATEELGDWQPREAEEVFVELVRLAKLSVSSSKSLFLWGSL